MCSRQRDIQSPLMKFVPRLLGTHHLPPCPRYNLDPQPSSPGMLLLTGHQSGMA